MVDTFSHNDEKDSHGVHCTDVDRAQCGPLHLFLVG